VLLTLGDACQNDDGRGCWPSVMRISGETEIGEHTVRRCLRDLCDRGLISKIARATQHRPAVYDINLDALIALSARHTTADLKSVERPLGPRHGADLVAATDRPDPHFSVQPGENNGSGPRHTADERLNDQLNNRRDTRVTEVEAIAVGIRSATAGRINFPELLTETRRRAADRGIVLDDTTFANIVYRCRH